MAYVQSGCNVHHVRNTQNIIVLRILMLLNMREECLKRHWEMERMSRGRRDDYMLGFGGKLNIQTC